MGALVHNGEFYTDGSNDAGNVYISSNEMSLETTLTAQDGLGFNFVTDGEGHYGFVGSNDEFVQFRNGVDEKKTGYVVYEFTNGKGRALLIGMYDGITDPSIYITFTNGGYPLYLDANVDMEFTWFDGVLSNNGTTQKGRRKGYKEFIQGGTRYTFTPGDNHMGFGLFTIL